MKSYCSFQIRAAPNLPSTSEMFSDRVYSPLRLNCYFSCKFITCCSITSVIPIGNATESLLKTIISVPVNYASGLHLGPLPHWNILVSYDLTTLFVGANVCISFILLVQCKRSDGWAM
jgi:hypothetical protein